jgi:hypothetical protein
MTGKTTNKFTLLVDVVVVVVVVVVEKEKEKNHHGKFFRVQLTLDATGLDAPLDIRGGKVKVLRGGGGRDEDGRRGAAVGRGMQTTSTDGRDRGSCRRTRTTNKDKDKDKDKEEKEEKEEKERGERQRRERKGGERGEGGETGEEKGGG